MSYVSMICVVGIGLNIASFGINSWTANQYYQMGDNARGNEYAAWALLDIVFLALPFIGPGARMGGGGAMALAGGGIEATAVALSKAGVKVSALYGYLIMLAHAGGGIDWGVSYSTGGGTSGGNPATQGTWGRPSHANGMRQNPQSYQHRIASQFGDPPPPNVGDEFHYNGVDFDGVNHTLKKFIEAKGELYEFIIKTFYYEGKPTTVMDDALRQMNRQANAARGSGYKIEWRVAEDYTREEFIKIVNKNGLDDIIEVIWSP